MCTFLLYWSFDAIAAERASGLKGFLEDAPVQRIIRVFCEGTRTRPEVVRTYLPIAAARLEHRHMERPRPEYRRAIQETDALVGVG